MKKLILGLLVAVITLTSSATSWAGVVNVRGYVRSNGTYVGPHIRTSPNTTIYDNFGSF